MPIVFFQRSCTLKYDVYRVVNVLSAAQGHLPTPMTRFGSMCTKTSNPVVQNVALVSFCVPSRYNSSDKYFLLIVYALDPLDATVVEPSHA